MNHSSASPLPRPVADLLAIGLGKTPHAAGQAEAAEIARRFCPPDTPEQRLLPALYRRTRVQNRGSVLIEDRDADQKIVQSFYPQCRDAGDRGPTTEARMQAYARHAAPLAEQATRDALGRAGIDPAEITELVTVTCTGFYAPGLDIGLIKSLALRPTVGRTQVGFMGCHGALNGLRVAGAMCAANPAARVLLCAVELCSLHYRYGWDPEQIVANALFADGAAAAVLSAVDETSTKPALRLAANGACVLPDSLDAMTWTVQDNGFVMTLSPRVPELIATHLRGWMTEWLGGLGLRPSDVRSWAVHPGGPRIVEAVRETLELRPEQTAASEAVLADYGNMSSPTLLFILERLAQSSPAGPCVALGFGPGLVAEAALLL